MSARERPITCHEWRRTIDTFGSVGPYVLDEPPVGILDILYSDVCGTFRPRMADTMDVESESAQMCAGNRTMCEF